MLLSAG